MSKAFTKETDEEQDDGEPEFAVPGGKNYITRAGFDALQAERHHLLREERPKVVEVVSWAAGNGDRSENGDYLYGKKRLREIDRRIRFLTKRMEAAEIVDPAMQKNREQVFFGATVSYADSKGAKHVVTIVGADETNSDAGRISWLSPVARALLKAYEDDVVEVRTPSGIERLEVRGITYPD